MFDDLLPRFRLDAALARDENIQVADGFAPAAQRTGGRDFLYPRNRQQMLHQFFRQFFGRVEQESSRDAAIVFNRLKQLQFVLFAHARQRADLAFARQLLHALEVADLIGAPDQRNRLRPQTLNLEQFEHRGAVFFQELGVRLDAAIFEKHLQIGQHAFANALYFEKFLRLLDQVGHLLRQRFNSLRSVAIRAHSKRVLPVDLQQIGSLVENSGDGFVVHPKLSSFGLGR